MKFKTKTPSSYEAFKKSVYGGTVYIVPATAATLELVNFAKRKIKSAQESEKNIGNAVLEVRHILTQPDTARSFIATITKDFNLDARNTVFDVLRLRHVEDKGHMDPAKKPAYSVHRDTWYANPQCQINWWIPLHDLDEKQSFKFFPHFFDRPIGNTSDTFDYKRWINEGGFQSETPRNPARYPTSTSEPVDKDTTAFSAKAGDIIIFAASHLHQTCLNDTGKPRFSIDFRTVDIDDKVKGRGAPDVDNNSQGDATVDYLRLG